MKQNKLLFAVRICLFFCLFFFIQIASAKRLEIETIEIYPFGYKDAGGKETGLMFDISNLIALHSGLEFKNTIIPYARTIVDLKNGNADFVIRYSNSEIAEVASPVATIIGFQSIILGRKGIAYKTLADLHGKTVGVIRGANFDDNFNNDKKIQKYNAKDYEQIFNMLLENRVDAIIGSEFGIFTTAKKLDIKRDRLGEPLLLQKKYFILHYKKLNADQQTIRTLKNTIEKLKRSGEFEKIKKSYEAKLL